MRDRQNWAASQLDEWYLFPETLPATRNPVAYSNVSDYVDSLTAAARAQGRDRYFTYVTSIAEENAYYESGSTASFGFRLQIDAAARRVWIVEVLEGSSAAGAGLKRGQEILQIGASPSTMQSVSSILAQEGEYGIWYALGAENVGIARTIQVAKNGLISDARVMRTEFALNPVPQVHILQDGGEQIGYINLRTFISTANQPLRQAFGNFRAQGVNRIIIDLRYNGGGLVSTAELMGDLMGGDRSQVDVLSYTRYRPSKSHYDETRRFQRQPETLSPTKLAFIVTGASASASEMVINSMTPWMRENSAIIGSNSYGKPVGQIAQDRSDCDDRLRIIAFKIENADRQGEYFDGLAGRTGASCKADDDIDAQMGSPTEASTRTAMDFLMGRSCTPMAAGARAQSVEGRKRALLPAGRPSTAQRESPGIF